MRESSIMVNSKERIEQSLSKKREEGTTPDAALKGNNVHTIKFRKNREEDMKNKMRNQMFTQLPEPFLPYFLNVWPLTL